MKRASTPEVAEGRGAEGAPSLTLESLRGKALALLARREHSRQELQRKLGGLGGEAPLVEQVLDELLLRKLQSDDRFAEVFVRSRAGRGYGPLVIGRELKERGLDAGAASLALEASGYDWLEQARDVRQRRFGEAPPADLKERARQYRFLQYRGFSGAQVAAALGGGAFADD